MRLKLNPLNLFFLSFFTLFLATGCTTVKFVQPYDEALVTGVQNFYKSSAQFIEDAKRKSPQNRPSSEDTSNTGHITHFTNGYDLLLIETNLLVMRAMVNSVKVDELGQSMQGKVTKLIDEKLPSVCIGNTAMLGDDFSSLTVQNFTDLKCVIANWKVQHENAPTKILTKGDWTRRHRTLIDIVFTIQKAESFKQIEKTI